jgi:hypothetical protein
MPSHKPKPQHIKKNKRNKIFPDRYNLSRVKREDIKLKSRHENQPRGI